MRAGFTPVEGSKFHVKPHVAASTMFHMGAGVITGVYFPLGCVEPSTVTSSAKGPRHPAALASSDSPCGVANCLQALQHGNTRGPGPASQHRTKNGSLDKNFAAC